MAADDLYLFLRLSPREQEVLRLIVEGQSGKQIARTLGINYKTVRAHITHLMRKLEVESRTQAAVLALRSGWLE